MKNDFMPTFTGRNVPIKEIAQATGKDPQYIRIGLQRGIFRFGYAFKRTVQVNTTIFVLTRKYGRI